ncbi:hypothetical protein RAO22_07220 [Pediococcus acidilactici]
MKASKISLIFLAVLIVILFSIDNAFPFITQGFKFSTGSLERSICYVSFLYVWGLFTLFKHRRFAAIFLRFINAVYMVGFISNVITTSSKRWGTIELFFVVISIVGMATIYLFNKYVGEY